MLNLLKLNKSKPNKSVNKMSQITKGDNVNPNRHFPPLTKSWFNSIYTYDKNWTNSMGYLDTIVNKAIKMYFFLNSKINLTKGFTRRRIKEKNRSAYKVFVSKAEIKHSSDKVIITLYTYNITKKIIAKTLSKLYRQIFYYMPLKQKHQQQEMSNNIAKLALNKNISIVTDNYNKLEELKKSSKRNDTHKQYTKLFVYQYFFSLYKNMLIDNTSNYLIYSKFKSISKVGLILFNKFLLRSNYIYKILKDKNLYGIIRFNKDKLKFLNLEKFKVLDKYRDEYYNLFITETLNKELLYLRYNQMLMDENYKFNNIYLLRFGKLLSRVYNKKIEFNIINLKYFFLDSRIFTDYIALKIRDRKNKFTSILRKAMSFQKINSIKKYNYKANALYIKRYNSLKKYNASTNEDAINYLLNKIFNISLERTTSNNLKGITKEKSIYKSIRFRKIRGVRLEAKGRLTKRLTAARSIFRLKYRGSLRSLDSINNFPCVILRGHLGSNIDYVNLNSKTRNGSFGLKGWISSK